MSRYRYSEEEALAKRQGAWMYDDLDRRRSMSVEATERPSGTLSGLRLTPEPDTFRCGDALALLVYDYFTRSVSRVQGKQEVFKLTVDGHLCREERSCRCRYIIGLIRRYFDCWWADEELSPGDRVESLDSARIDRDGLELIACVVEGWAMRGLRVTRR